MKTTRGDLVRGGAAAAAVVLAVLSQGDALALAAALLVVAWHPVALIVVPALVASSWRWGSTSLDALAGAQAVLGPAGLVGPARAAAVSWLAAVAVVLCSPASRAPMHDASKEPPVPAAVLARRRPRNGLARLSALAVGATAADIVAGPSLGGAWWLRLAATVLATGLALVVSRLRQKHPRPLDALAIAAGVMALVMVSGEAPRWSGTVDGDGVRAGLLLAVAVIAAATVGARAATAMRDRWA